MFSCSGCACTLLVVLVPLFLPLGFGTYSECTGRGGRYYVLRIGQRLGSQQYYCGLLLLFKGAGPPPNRPIFSGCFSTTACICDALIIMIYIRHGRDNFVVNEDHQFHWQQHHYKVPHLHNHPVLHLNFCANEPLTGLMFQRLAGPGWLVDGYKTHIHSDAVYLYTSGPFHARCSSVSR